MRRRLVRAVAAAVAVASLVASLAATPPAVAGRPCAETVASPSAVRDGIALGQRTFDALEASAPRSRWLPGPART